MDEKLHPACRPRLTISGVLCLRRSAVQVNSQINVRYGDFSRRMFAREAATPG